MAVGMTLAHKIRLLSVLVLLAACLGRTTGPGVSQQTAPQPGARIATGTQALASRPGASGMDAAAENALLAPFEQAPWPAALDALALAPGRSFVILVLAPPPVHFDLGNSDAGWVPAVAARTPAGHPRRDDAGACHGRLVLR